MKRKEQTTKVFSTGFSELRGLLLELQEKECSGVITIGLDGGNLEKQVTELEVHPTTAETFEKDSFRGRKNRKALEGATQKRAAEFRPKQERWLKMAREMKKKKPGLSKRSLARIIHTKTGDSESTIRNYLNAKAGK